MLKSPSLTQLALIGIAAGFLSQNVRADGKMATPKTDSTMTKTAPADSASMAMAQAHGCKGMNECKGHGGCKTSKKELKERAQKAGMAMSKAGKAHDCKGKNECKGLGGCKTM
jgi:hypothetical protein